MDFEHSLNAAIKRLRASIGDSAREPRFIETVPGRGYRWRTSSAASSGLRLAVLPFAAGSSEDDFAGGLADEVIAQLGRCGDGRLRVIARMSALACTAAVQRASDVARLLAADFLVEGSVRRHAERARIAVWLVDAREEVQTWRDCTTCQSSIPSPRRCSWRRRSPTRSCVSCLDRRGTHQAGRKGPPYFPIAGFSPRVTCPDRWSDGRTLAATT